MLELRCCVVFLLPRAPTARRGAYASIMQSGCAGILLLFFSSFSFKKHLTNVHNIHYQVFSFVNHGFDGCMLGCMLQGKRTQHTPACACWVYVGVRLVHEPENDIHNFFTYESLPYVSCVCCVRWLGAKFTP